MIDWIRRNQPEALVRHRVVAVGVTGGELLPA